ncbi:hypothetical protein [Piscinibacter sp. HJYY11]|uniref:hypothetical protein n=1 Tax=Piscinibacter sp. HJYY11 TaxID=2801333 RepID=UPI00191E08D0|nr:hypothetical protein [Piscinibacter sp. HJYY11]MBL0726207.1 hypothetical protein [Piscinibacter sp. HJYY11]
MIAAGGALLAATPSSAERPGQVLTAVREHRLPTAAPRPSVQSQFGSVGSGARSARPRADDVVSDARRAPKEEPMLEPWSLMAGGLSVMVFIARRRRSD